MIHKIRVASKFDTDLKGQGILQEIKHTLKTTGISKVITSSVYRIDGITKEEAEKLATTLLSEEINQVYSINQPLLTKARQLVEISYKPGVMNPEVASIVKAAEDLGIHPTNVTTSREYGFVTDLPHNEIVTLVRRLNLYNPIIEYIIESDDPVKIIPLIEMSDDELMLLSKDSLFLNLTEMKAIQKYFKKLKRNPTDVELETLAQTWSEHCAHKTFKAKLTIDGKEKAPLFSRIRKEALKHDKNIVSAFIDNSGVMDFYDGFGICGKVETHNSPSAIEPYGGAMTGSGGVFRDIVGTGEGAKPIASTDIFCLARPDLPASELPPGCLPPDYIFKRVVAGVRDYGNRIGIPTNNGSVHFHDDFRAKPSIIVGSYGFIPKKYAQKGSPKVGDLIVAVGGRTGRDGVHGATFSSGEMTERTITVNSSAVQIGNAIEEKRMFDAILEARDQNLIRAMQDCGAGGFSSAIGEMGEETGVHVDLEKAALKYEGLKPWEIWISESQERMVLAIPKTKLSAFKEICKKYNVEISVLGYFDGSERLQLFYEGEPVADISMDFLHNGLAQREMVGHKPHSAKRKEQSVEPKLPSTEREWLSLTKKIVAHGNIASKEPIVRVYDHSVQGTNDLQPYSGVHLNAPNDAAVIRPILDKPYGMVLSHGLNPVLTTIDPYMGSMWAIAEALANYVAVGGDFRDASLINNYIWPFPDEESLWSLDRSVDAVVDAMKIFGIPVISGKDSLSSTYRNKDGTVIKIPPVLCMSVFGKIPDTRKTVTTDLKKAGSTLVLLGDMDTEHLGGSIYYDIHGLVGNTLPDLKMESLPVLFTSLYQAMNKGQILSCHDVSEGGLFVTLFEMAIGGDFGVTINLTPYSRERIDSVLFNETAGRFVVEVEDQKTAEDLFTGVPYTILGTTTDGSSLDFVTDKKSLFSVDLNDLVKAWQRPMREVFNS